MRVLAIAATPFFSNRGSHVRIYNEAKSLQDLGNQIKICTYHIGDNVASLDISRIGRVNWYKRIVPGFSWGKGWLSIKLCFLVIKEIRDFKPEIIHAHLYESLVLGYLAKKILFRKIPIIFDVQGDLAKEFDSYNEKNKFAKKIFVWLAKRVINWADYVVVSSKNALKYIKRDFRGEISVLEDGVDLSIFSSFVKSPLQDEIAKWKVDNRLLIYTGGLNDSKGVGELLEEFSALKTAWKLLVMGSGKDFEKYKKYNSSKIKVIESLKYFELPGFLKLADLAIDPKTNSTEASGKLVNYMPAGLPIVCYDNEFNKNILKDKGIFIKNMNELENILSKTYERQNYDLSKIDQKNNAKVLQNICKKIVEK